MNKLESYSSLLEGFTNPIILVDPLPYLEIFLLPKIQIYIIMLPPILFTYNFDNIERKNGASNSYLLIIRFLTTMRPYLQRTQSG